MTPVAGASNVEGGGVSRNETGETLTVAGDRIARLRAQQVGAATMTPYEAAEALLAHIQPHEDHTWEQVGRCVYCVDCDARLYQGTVPSDHAKVRRRSWSDASDPAATNAMRERWGK